MEARTRPETNSQPPRPKGAGACWATGPTTASRRSLWRQRALRRWPAPWCVRPDTGPRPTQPP
eukprot:11488113-Alexandrium_andersonii.AAC.1